MGSKKLKAIAVRGKGNRPPVANPEKLEALVKYISGSWHGAGLGAALSHIPSLSKKQMICYGCPTGCVRTNMETTDGVKAKVCCQSVGFYIPAAGTYYGKSTNVPLHASRLCQDYGLDTYVIASILRWLEDGYKAGVLTEANTGLPLSDYGSWEFIETLVKKISLREGFGDALAQGLVQAADSIGSKARELITDYADKNGQNIVYGPRLYNINGIFYATEPRMSLTILKEITNPMMMWEQWIKGVEGAYMSNDMLCDIGKTFWGSELTFDFSTYEGKAIAAKKIQDKIRTEECLILCAFFYPLRACESTETHESAPAVESELYSAVTGNETDEEGLNRIGERVFNLERAVLTREDPRGKKVDEIAEFNFNIPLQGDRMSPECLVPGKDGEPISQKGAVVDWEKFAKMLSEYYELRGWDKSSGLQTKQKLAELDLSDIAEGLAQKGLVA
jgi:aldehyde:ferredoxin oxidoreductase